MKNVVLDSGFTLVELMVVVLIIGILVAIAVPVFGSARDTSAQRACFANQRIIEGAVQTYHAAVGVLPPVVAAGGTAGDGSALITGNYLRGWPYCPALASGGATSTLAYGIDANGWATRSTTGANSSGGTGDPHQHP